MKISFDFAGRQVLLEDRQQALASSREADAAAREDWLFEREGKQNIAETRTRSAETLMKTIRDTLELRTQKELHETVCGIDEGKPAPSSRYKLEGDVVEGEVEQTAKKLVVGSESAGPVYLPHAYESPHNPAEGIALSLHQPYASLIVEGFKRAEGRTWLPKLPAEGCALWIHAASKEPDPDLTRDLEQFYANLYADAGLPAPPLPESYPTSCILGCVDVKAVVVGCDERMEHVASSSASAQRAASNSEWVFLDERNEPEFVILCQRPRRLVVPVRCSGQHKLWRLPSDLAANLPRALRPTLWPRPENPSEIHNTDGMQN